LELGVATPKFYQGLSAITEDFRPPGTSSGLLPGAKHFVSAMGEEISARFKERKINEKQFRLGTSKWLPITALLPH
jgi:hypothetical protein